MHTHTHVHMCTIAVLPSFYATTYMDAPTFLQIHASMLLLLQAHFVLALSFVPLVLKRDSRIGLVTSMMDGWLNK